MKKIIILISLFYLTIFNVNAFQAIENNKNSIDNIKCDLSFQGEIRQGRTINFSDKFENINSKKLKIDSFTINYYEEDNYNNGKKFPDFSYTSWLKSKNFTLNPGEKNIVIKADSGYTVLNLPKTKSYNNFKIAYTAKYYLADANGNFNSSPLYHTECKSYKISGCGDGIVDEFYGEKCDPKDPNKKNWGTGGCSNTCQVIEKTSITNPSCKSTVASVTTGTEKLDSTISCSGTDVSKFTIDCGNGQKFYKTYSSIQNSANFSKTCNYTKAGNYVATCLVNDSKTNNSCKKTVTVNKKTVEKQAKCLSTSITKKLGTGKLNTIIKCNGLNVKKFEINCGNGQKYFKNGSNKGLDFFSHTCNYSKPGNYIASCKVDNLNEIEHSCIENIEVKNQNTEDLTIYEKYIKQEIFKHRANIIKYNKILKDENERGISLIKLPKILPKTGTPISKRVIKLKNPKLNLDIIESRFRLAGNNNSDLNFWKQVLPNEDKNAKKYIVIPSNGLVMPINEVPSDVTDYNLLLSGREIKINKYLKTGAMEYAGTSINGYGKVGNKVIFAHSSYFKSDNGRYKTDFQKIIELNKGEEIWIYVKENGKYKRYKYKTVESYNTKPTNIDVLKPGIGKNLTLFTCTPIGGINGRWIIKAKYIDDDKINLENKIKFNNINSEIKSKINLLIYKISKLEEKEKKEKILKIFKILIQKENSIRNLKSRNILNYLKYKLTLEYYK